MRLSPRDANWIGDDNEYHCCVVRPELISHYITAKQVQMAADELKKELDTLLEREKPRKRIISDENKENSETNTSDISIEKG